MIKCNVFYRILIKNGFNFFTGVPDSLLKNICAYIDDNVSAKNHVIAANEGNAVGIAAGYYLATGKPAVIYLQNSGLGNTINPLTSLTSNEVYSIPALLLVGWRGAPGEKDEPQHMLMGKIQSSILKTLDIPSVMLGTTDKEAKNALKKVRLHLISKKAPVALVVKRDTFAPYKSQKKGGQKALLTREESLEVILNAVGKQDVIISTTGKTSRELFELRTKRREGHEKDFLTVGSMGHVSSIALGVALQKKSRRIWCIDGDGSLLMHMGSLSTVGKIKPSNFNHVVINNFAHESVGGQPTASSVVNLTQVARYSGYKNTYSTNKKAVLMKLLKKMKTLTGPIMLEIQCKVGSRAGLGRPTVEPKKNKVQFMKFLKN